MNLCTFPGTARYIADVLREGMCARDKREI